MHDDESIDFALLIWNIKLSEYKKLQVQIIENEK